MISRYPPHMNLKTWTGVVIVLTLSPWGCGDSSAMTEDATTAGADATTETSEPTATAATTAGSETGSGSTDATTEPTTDATTDPTDATTDATTDPTTTASTTDPTTTDATTATTDPTDTDTEGTSSACGVADGDYGDCDAALGWAFDGVACQLRSGCDCGRDCALFFPTVVACAQSCAAAGECNEDKLVGTAIAKDLELGGGCDSISTCGPDDPAFADQLLEYFDALYGCEADGFCGGQRCTIDAAVEVDEALWLELCAASLDPSLGEIECAVIGP